MFFSSLTLEPAKLNELMHKICVLSHRNHITLLLHG